MVYVICKGNYYLWGWNTDDRKTKKLIHNAGKNVIQWSDDIYCASTWSSESRAARAIGENGLTGCRVVKK